MTEKLRQLLRRRSHFISLNIKLTAIILIAAGLAIGIYAVSHIFEDWAGQKFFNDTQIKTRLVDDRYKTLTDYVKKNDVKGSDAKALQDWIDSERYTQIVVYNGEKATFTSGLSMDKNGQVSVDSQNLDQGGQFGSSGSNVPKVKIITNQTAKTFKPDLYNRVVRFSDGWYYVYINVNNEQGWYRLMDVISVIVAIGVFFVIILSYNKWVLRRIFSVSDDVRLISEGELDHSMPADAKDEIGDLVTSVEIMRQSLLEKMQSEQAAKDANTELITSMSHDIRTPLTSLIGYLDIIAGGKYKSQEEFEKYIASCKDKAFQLKGLSDKLFNYFLVFGDEEETREFEPMDGGILFRQMIGEHIMELERYGYTVNTQYTIPDQTMIRVEIDGLMRVFDNLFSNMMKYASTDFPIEIKASLIQGKIKLIFQNHIVTEARAVESTKIGVKTCRKICEDHHAAFRAMEEERIYTTEILWPTMPKAEAARVEKQEQVDELVEKIEAQAGNAAPREEQRSPILTVDSGDRTPAPDEDAEPGAPDDDTV